MHLVFGSTGMTVVSARKNAGIDVYRCDEPASRAVVDQRTAATHPQESEREAGGAVLVEDDPQAHTVDARATQARQRGVLHQVFLDHQAVPARTRMGFELVVQRIRSECAGVIERT